MAISSYCRPFVKARRPINCCNIEEYVPIIANVILCDSGATYTTPWCQDTFHVSEQGPRLLFESAHAKVEFNKNTQEVKYVVFYKESSPPLSSKQRTLYKNTSKIPASYRNIASDSAVTIAKSFLARIIGGNEAVKYDSAVVYEGAKNYHVDLKVPGKGYVEDQRSVSFRINSATGRILSYSGWLTKRKLPEGYTPRIGHDEVLAIIDSVEQAKDMQIEIHELVVRGSCFGMKDERPVWQGLISVSKEIDDKMMHKWFACEGCFRCTICIDAETGEVAGANLPPGW